VLYVLIFGAFEGSRNVLDFRTILDMEAKRIDSNFFEGFGITLKGWQRDSSTWRLYGPKWELFIGLAKSGYLGLTLS